MSISQYLVTENEAIESAPSFDQYLAPGVDVSFQLPPFIFSAAPAVAQGGGAEVITANSFSPSPSAWYQNVSPNVTNDGPFLSSISMLFPPDLSQPARTPPSNTQPQYNESQPSQSTAVATFGSTDEHSPTSRHMTPLLLSAPSALGLPIYSASGFDILNILSRVVTRRNAKITLGPVDLTCSFVIVDVRRFDSPIVYCSPSFCKLTGYEESEIVGRNCRFLQAPDGCVQRGEHRQYTAPEPVMHLRKSLSADKECQTSLINFRKGGQAFMNLVTVIPIAGGVTGFDEDEDQVVYHVGFQVDLTEQPNRILQRLRDGNYAANHRSPCDPSATPPYLVGGISRDRRDRLRRLPGAMSKELRAQLANPAFVDSIPLTISTTTTTVTTTSPSSSSSSTVATGISAEKVVFDSKDGNQLLNLILLESAPDFVHVLSLKGSFLYVAPSVRLVLGYEPDELVGKSVADFCHPADVIPLMRELKESSASPSPAPDPANLVQITRSVDLLYRARSKAGNFVWVEARGRLFVEPGKGRKAIILSGRMRRMQRLEWGAVSQGEDTEMDKAFWASVCAEGTFLVVGSAVRDVLGWGVTEVMGRTLATFVIPDGTTSLQDEVGKMAYDASASEPRKFWVNMMRKDGSHVGVVIVLYRPTDDTFGPSLVICQIRVAHAPITYEQAMSNRPLYPPSINVFEELETSRGSSWQYELQQLKFSNQRLVEEIAMLEGHKSPQPSPNMTLPVHTIPPPPQHSHQDWLQSSSHHHASALSSLKRAWNDAR